MDGVLWKVIGIEILFYYVYWIFVIVMRRELKYLLY